MPVELAHFARVPVLATHTPVELLSASYATHHFAPHAHDELAIGVLEDGAVRTRVGARTIVVPSGGWIIALNPGDVHTGEPVDDAGYRYRMFYIDTSLFREVIGWNRTSADSGSTSTPSFTSPAIYDPALAGRLICAHTLLENGADRLLAEGAFVDALGDLAHRHGCVRASHTEKHGNADVVRVVREYLEDEFARVVTLAELSALTGLSPFHVSRTFRSSVGLPPYAYLALVRVRQAQALIRAGHPLSAVTHATGFADQSHFTRQFKRAVGVPPGQYARDIARSPTGSSHPTPSRPARPSPFGPPSHRSAHPRGNSSRRELALGGPSVRHYNR